MSRRVSVDFSVPALAPRLSLDSRQDMRLIPLTYLRKKSLVHFDLRDENGLCLPLVGLRQTQALTESMLDAWAKALLRLPLDEPWPDEALRQCLHDVAAGSQEDLVAALHRWKTAVPGTLMHRLHDDPCLRVLLNRLASDFVLLIPVSSPPMTRRIIKFSYDEPLSLRDKHTTLQPEGDEQREGRIAVALGWTGTRIRFPTPAAENCQSYHFEIEAPEGVQIVDASLLADRPGRTGGISFDRVGGGFPRVNLHVVDVPKGSVSEAQVILRVAREGWLTTLVLACWATVALTVAAAALYRTSEPSEELAISIFASVTGAVATLLVRPHGHRMATRLSAGLDTMATVATALPFLAAGLILLAPSRAVTASGLLLLAVLALGAAVAVTITLVAVSRPAPTVLSPWEQGPLPEEWRSKQGSRTAPARTYDSYEDAATEHGYHRQAILVMTSEGLRPHEPRDVAAWNADLQGRIDHALREALAVARGGWSGR